MVSLLKSQYQCPLYLKKQLKFIQRYESSIQLTYYFIPDVFVYLQTENFAFQLTKSYFIQVVAMQVKRGGEWVKWNYEKYLNDVNMIARAYINIGLHRHHSVVLLGANSPEWVIGNLAAIFAG